MNFRQLPYGVFVESFENGWGIVSRLGDDRNVMTLFTNAGNPCRLAFSQYENWPILLSETAGLKYYLTAKSPVKITGHDASSSIPQAVAGKNWSAIGDAALTFDPLSSHGITNALFTAKKLAESITDNRGFHFTDYNESILNIFNGYMDNKEKLYQEEKRWSNNSFWSEAHSKKIVPSL